MPSDQGRLLKKDELAGLDGLEIAEYPWQTFSPNGVLFLDNPRKSVMLKDVHSAKEIAEKVKVASQFQKSLGPKSNPLVPVDLTKDYNAYQREIMLRRKRHIFDEDDSAALDLADLAALEEVESQGLSWRRDKVKPVEGEGQTPEVGRTSPLEPANGASPPSSTVKSSPPTERAADLDPSAVEQTEVEAAIRAAATSEPFHQTVSGTDATGALAQPQEGGGSSSPASMEELEEIKNRAWEESYQAGYQEGYQAGIAAGEPEGRTQGQAQGFESGYREGEERALTAVESRTERFFATLAAAVREVGELKSSVLQEGQEIFLELAKICTERLLRHEIQTSDDALRRLYGMAVDAFTEKDSIAVEMNPQDAARFRRIVAAEGTANPRIVVRENESLSSGDFKVEADSQIVLVDLKKSIDGILEAMRLELFGERKVG